MADYNLLTQGKTYIVGSTTGCSTLMLAIDVVNALGTSCTLWIPQGTHSITSDKTINATVSVIVDNGALITPAGGSSITPTVTYADGAGTGTISCTHNTTLVTSTTAGAFDSIKSGDYIYPDSQPTYRKKVAFVQNSKRLYLWEPFHASNDISADTYHVSSTTITFSNVHGLEIGDWISIGGTPDRYYVTTTPTTATATVCPSPAVASYSGAAVTRGYRLKILGEFQAGRYQCINTPVTGGVVKFGINVDEVYPEWWGAVANINGSTQGTANTLAFNRALFSAILSPGSPNYIYTRQKVKFGRGQYVTNGEITPPAGSVLEGEFSSGQVATGSKIAPYTSPVSFHVIQSPRDTLALLEANRISNLAISGSATAMNLMLLQETYVDHCNISGGLWNVWSVDASHISDNWFTGGINGVRLHQDSHFNNNDLSILGNNTAGEYYFGVVLATGLCTCEGNIVYGPDQTADLLGTYIGVYDTNQRNVWHGGRIDNFDYNYVCAWANTTLSDVVLQDPYYDNITIAWAPADFTSGTLTTGIEFGINIHDNLIVGKSGRSRYGINMAAGYVGGGAITNNTIQGTYSGAAFHDDGCFPTSTDYTIIENNSGIDRLTSLTLTQNSATPSVLAGKYFKTGNSSGTTITNFTQGFVGKEIWVQVNDTNTTFDFSGTNLKGNAAANWRAAGVAHVGDILHFISDGTNWYCLGIGAVD